jgi:hypothetical protein
MTPRLCCSKRSRAYARTTAALSNKTVGAACTAATQHSFVQCAALYYTADCAFAYNMFTHWYRYRLTVPQAAKPQAGSTNGRNQVH